MIVLVTGAAGFVGSNLVDMLLVRGDEVVGVDNFDRHYDPAVKRANLASALANPRFQLIETDILNVDCVRNVISTRRPGGIIHLAARVGNRGSLLAPDNENYSVVNVEGTRALLSVCREAPLRSFVYISTGNVYDSSALAPFREGVTPELPRTPYSRSKKEAEILVLEAAAQEKLPATVLRFFTILGPRQRPDMVHHHFAKALLNDEPLTVIGSGSDLRDYLHVHDGCAAILACLDRSPAGEVINVGSGQGISLDCLLALMARITGKTPRIRCQPSPANDTPVLLADIAKAEKQLGWRPRTSLEIGLRDFIAWMMTMEGIIKTNGVRYGH